MTSHELKTTQILLLKHAIFIHVQVNASRESMEPVEHAPPPSVHVQNTPSH